jgi:hypothetical protein
MRTRYGFLTDWSLYSTLGQRLSSPAHVPAPSTLRMPWSRAARARASSPASALRVGPGSLPIRAPAAGKRPRVPYMYAIPRPHAKEFSRSDQPRIEPGAGNRGGSMRGWTATLLTARQSGCSVGQAPWERKNARAAFSRELPVPSLVSATASAQGGIGNDTSGRSTTRIRLSRFVWIISLRRSLRHTERSTRSCQLV